MEYHLGLRNRPICSPIPTKVRRELFPEMEEEVKEEGSPKKNTFKRIKADEWDSESIATESVTSITSQDDEHYTETKRENLKKGQMVLLQGENWVVEKVVRRAMYGVVGVHFINLNMQKKYKKCDMYNNRTFMVLDK